MDSIEKVINIDFIKNELEFILVMLATFIIIVITIFLVKKEINKRKDEKNEKK